MATIKDISNYTGFSVTTISRVLNNDPTMSVTDETRAIILEAADELHYKPISVRRARRSRPLSVAIIEMMDLSEQVWDPYYLYLKNYVVRNCMEQGYQVSYLFEQKNGYQLPNRIRPDGILAIGIFSEAQIAQMVKICPTVVFVDSSPDEQRFDSVVLNFQLGVEEALDYLLQRGHRNIGFLGPTHKLDGKKRPAQEVRRNCFVAYMQKAGLYRPEWMIDTEVTVSATRQKVQEWIHAGGRLPTALLAYNEETAITAVSVLRDAGLRIPEDISIVSFNDTSLSKLIEPPLTGINAHLSDMGAVAVRLLGERVQAPQRLPNKVVLPLTLTERESVWDLTAE